MAGPILVKSSSSGRTTPTPVASVQWAGSGRFTTPKGAAGSDVGGPEQNLPFSSPFLAEAGRALITYMGGVGKLSRELILHKLVWGKQVEL